MKIAILSDLFYPYHLGGGENRYFWIAKNLVKLGHEVTVYTMKLQGSPNEEIFQGIKIKRLGISHSMSHRQLYPLPFYLLRSMMLLKNIVKEKYDLIDTNTYIPVFAGNLFSNLLKIPHVITFHDVYWDYWSSSLGKKWAGIIGPLMEFILARTSSSKIITVSRSSKNKLIYFLRVKDERISIVPNGIDLKRFNFKSKVKKEPFTLTYVGRLVPHKHVDDLIEAFKLVKKEIPEAKLNIIGSGELKNKLEALSKEINNDGIKFYGYISNYDKVMRIVSNSTVLVNPSTIEGFGIVLIEAMAAKTPIIAYNLPAYRDFAKNNENAVLVPQRNIPKLAKAILKIIKDSNYRTRIIDNGYKTASYFDWSSITKKIEEIYYSLINKI